MERVVTSHQAEMLVLESMAEMDSRRLSLLLKHRCQTTLTLSLVQVWQVNKQTFATDVHGDVKSSY